MTEFCDIQKLADLLKLDKTDDSESGDEREDELTETTSKQGQHSSGSKSIHKKKKPNPYSKIENDGSKRKEILQTDSEEYIPEDQEHSTSSDWKKTPKWDIAYKQKITASDVFLQMGFKNPGTASCEDMIVTISLPGEDRHNIELNIFKDKLKLVSPNFHLDLPLPQPVDPKEGNAQFDAESERLIVTLRMCRDLDLVNF